MESKYPFTGACRKDDSIRESQVENCCAQKSRKQFLAEAHCDYIRMPSGKAVCPPDHVYSSYLGSLFIRKRKEFRRSRADKLLRKTCSAKKKIQYSDSFKGDGRKRETEKIKPNIEIVTDEHCDVLVVVLALNRRKRTL